MGYPVVHFEIMGKDSAALAAFYSQLFDWRVDANNPMNYGLVAQEENLNPDGIGIGGGIGQMPEGEAGFVTIYVEVPDLEAALVKAESLGGTRIMGPEKVMEGVEVAIFLDPEGHAIGLAKSG